MNHTSESISSEQSSLEPEVWSNYLSEQEAVCAEIAHREQRKYLGKDVELQPSAPLTVGYIWSRIAHSIIKDIIGLPEKTDVKEKVRRATNHFFNEMQRSHNPKLREHFNPETGENKINGVVAEYGAYRMMEKAGYRSHLPKVSSDHLLKADILTKQPDSPYTLALQVKSMPLKRNRIKGDQKEFPVLHSLASFADLQNFIKSCQENFCYTSTEFPDATGKTRSTLEASIYPPNGDGFVTSPMLNITEEQILRLPLSDIKTSIILQASVDRNHISSEVPLLRVIIAAIDIYKRYHSIQEQCRAENKRCNYIPTMCIINSSNTEFSDLDSNAEVSDDLALSVNTEANNITEDYNRLIFSKIEES